MPGGKDAMKDEAIVAQHTQGERRIAASEAHLPAWLPKAVLVIARIVLGYLFFTQLFWKLPPSFSCSPDFRFTTANADGSLVRGDGLCDWIGIESVWATRPHTLLRAGRHIGVPISWAARVNGVFIDHVVEPNIRWFGWVIWGTEAFIFLSLCLGLFSRLGALVAIGMATQLVVGIAGISDPEEWEWGYNLILLLAIVLFVSASGRIFGLDARLRPRLLAEAARGNRIARFVLLLT